MLGNTLVGVSVLYKLATIFPNIVSDVDSGLNVRPLGYIMHIIIHTDMPIISERAKLMNSWLFALSSMNTQEAAMYTNHRK